MMKRSVFARMAVGMMLFMLLCGCAVGAMAAFDPSLYPEFTFEVDGSSVKLTEYTGSATEVVIPEGVTSIGFGVFRNNEVITSVDIPESVTSIGNSVFSWCTSLTKVELPSSLTSIGYDAFKNCWSLTLYLPSDIDYVGESAFSSCQVFADMNSATAVALGNSDNKFSDPSYPELDLLVAETDGVRTCTVVDCDYDAVDVVIPDGVTAIGELAFEYCEDLESITLPDGITSIASEILPPDSRMTVKVYANYGSTTALTISKGNRDIDDYFYDLSNPQLKLRIEETDGVREVILVGCESEDSSLVVPDFVTVIGEEAFEGCDTLESITLPETLTAIEDSAFYSCYELKEIVIPDGVKSIGDYAFADCASLVSVTLPDGLNTLGAAFMRCYALSTITIPEGITDIPYGCFEECTALTTVNLPNTITYIGEYAFASCSSLKNISIPSGVAGISRYAFAGTGLEEITLSSAVTSVEEGAFSNCVALKEIAIPEGVKKLGNYAFAFCAALESVALPNGMTSLGNDTFMGCISLKSVTVPSGVTSILYRCFSGCTALSNVVLPKTVASLEWGAFENCTALKTLTIPSSVVSISANVFDDEGSEKKTIRCYEGSYADTWAQENGHTVVYIEAGAETTMILPASLTVISSESFSGVPVNVIVLPDGCEAIGDKAFANCVNLIRVEITASVTCIAPSAFEGCPADLAIAAPAGSYAETFAQNNGIAFIAE